MCPMIMQKMVHGWVKAGIHEPQVRYSFSYVHDWFDPLVPSAGSIFSPSGRDSISVRGSLNIDSQMYPFSNLTFDQMVETYLPRAKEIFQTGDLNEWKKERMAVLV